MDTVIDINNISFREILDNLYDGVYLVDKDRKIVYWNKGAERISGFSAEEVINHYCFENILQHVDDYGTKLCTFGCPLHKTIQDGKLRNNSVYLHHKDGHRVPVVVRTTPLTNEKGETVGGIEIFTENPVFTHRMTDITELKKLAFIDALTGLANRRFLDIQLERRIQDLNKHDWHFGVILIDLDHFKEINDQWGHSVGDQALKTIAKTLLSCSRSADIMCRWGGDEFMGILAVDTEAGLKIIVERFFNMVKTTHISTGDIEQPLSTSCGATLAKKNDTAETLLDRVDKLLRQSKENGRNQYHIG